MIQQSSYYFVLNARNKMKAVSIIFPHQLFLVNPCVDTSRMVYLVEEFLFFNQYSFHKQKIVLHRASMKSYEALLIKKKQPVIYISAKSRLSDIKKLIASLNKEGIEEIHYTDTVDNWLEKKIQEASVKNNIHPVKYLSPNFLTQSKDVDEYFTGWILFFAEASCIFFSSQLSTVSV